MELDPLLRDLTEKKLSFKRNVVHLATELKDVRNKLASQEQLFAKESKTRQVAEIRAKSMEEEVSKLQSCLSEKDEQLKLSSSNSEQYLKELDDLRCQLSVTRSTAESSAESAQSAQNQCLVLLKELNDKTCLLSQHEDRVTKLSDKSESLQKLLEAREVSQRQLKDEVLRIENDISSTVSKAGVVNLNEGLNCNFENLNKSLGDNDLEISRLRDEIRFLSAHWKRKTKELESQLEKQRRTDQELKKRVIKLEFCLQESRSQMRKLQRMGERRDRALKELRDQLAMKQQNSMSEKVTGGDMSEKVNFWESSGFKFMVSVSMLALVIVAKR
ncbi:hypothetical protein LUZ60_003426 [Juncus effusus]|nr:hypothetical protein LUZ60_003426 [Juncus effusus]